MRLGTKAAWAVSAEAQILMSTQASKMGWLLEDTEVTSWIPTTARATQELLSPPVVYILFENTQG